MIITSCDFNDKNSYDDFELIMESKVILPPSKKKIKGEVPFANSSYDFSTIGSNGEITYNDRNITVIFILPTISKLRLHILYSKVLEWLQDVPQSKLIFGDMKDYYFLAEVESASSFEEIAICGKLTVTFVAEPFKVGVNLEGNTLWDTFNFNTDVMQDTSYDVVGNKSINIINVGRLVTPTINCTAAMSITLNSKTYNLAIGDNTIYGLKLLKGDNNITVVGNGKIKFIFRKMSL